MLNPFKFRVVEEEVERTTYSGPRVRRPTVLIKLGRYSFSKRALSLGVLLAALQVMDGVLTYFGLAILGVHLEGNRFVRNLILAYGDAPGLVLAKLVALVFVAAITRAAHQHIWVRPLIVVLILVYLSLAVLPWVYILSDQAAKTVSAVEESEQTLRSGYLVPNNLSPASPSPGKM